MKGDKGITLIALVITIIIMLILAGVTLNAALGENGLIQRAKKASEEYRKAAEEESNGIDKLLDEMEKVSGENGETEPSPDPAETPEPEPTPTPDPTPTPEPIPTPEPTPTPGESAEDLNDKVEGESAGDVLGKTVEGLELAAGLDYKWQIFDVDETHIWLISTDYIKKADSPKKEGYAVGGDSAKPYCGNFTNVVNGYPTGAASVDNALQSLNQKFFTATSSSTNNNAKAMAYMLDKNIWTAKFIGSGSKDKVDFVIGGPTIEQIVNVNNKKHPDNQLELQANTTGYQIKKSGGSWNTSLSGALKTADSELVQTDTGKSNWMWVASPSANDDRMVVYVRYDGLVSNSDISSNYGFRPIVCLNSGVQLKDIGTGYNIQ